MKDLVVGVLALQGAFAKHVHMLQSLGAKTLEVRTPNDLAACDALIIPGGESTTMMKQMHFINFFEPFRKFAKNKPVFGTCAGLILMSHDIISDNMQPFNLLDITVERNAFGRQVDSFYADIDFNSTPSAKSIPLRAMFIRAPRIRRTGSEVQILATFQDEPIIVQQGHHLGATFHPELTMDTTIHAHFLKMCKK